MTDDPDVYPTQEAAHEALTAFGWRPVVPMFDCGRGLWLPKGRAHGAALVSAIVGGQWRITWLFGTKRPTSRYR
jgi:hypothetical protein